MVLIFFLMIQNIFMDQKSYELIQKNQDFEHICSIADAAMYANKKQLKGEDTIR